jgi:hypothetical protein
MVLRGHLFAVTLKNTNTLRAETDHGSLRVQKQWPLQHDIRYNQRQRGRRNCKSAALIMLHYILVLQLSLRSVQGYLKVNLRTLHTATRCTAKSLSTSIICYAHDWMNNCGNLMLLLQKNSNCTSSVILLKYNILKYEFSEPILSVSSGEKRGNLRCSAQGMQVNQRDKYLNTCVYIYMYVYICIHNRVTHFYAFCMYIIYT